MTDANVRRRRPLLSRRSLVWLNFVASVWALIGVSTYRVLGVLREAAFVQAAYGPFSIRLALAPLALITVELLLWYRPFRERGRGSRALAGFVGLALLVIVAVQLVLVEMYGHGLDGLMMAFFVYAGVSHLVFALLGRERRRFRPH